MPDVPVEHSPPKKKDVKKPEVKKDETGYAHFVGLRSQNQKNNLLQSDKPGSECVFLQSKAGDVYLEAAVQLQSESAKRIEHVSEEKILYTNRYTMHNQGNVETYVEHNTTYNSNEDFTLNVVGTHTENVVTQKINAQSQTVKVSGPQVISVVGDRTIKVRGKVIEEIGGDEIRNVTGKKALSVGADLLNTFLGGCTWMKASTDRGITISDKEQINIAGEVSLNVGASEKVNVGTTWEQTFGRKSSFEFSSVSTMAMGTKKEIDMVTLINKGPAYEKWESKMFNRMAKIELLHYNMRKIASKINFYS